MSDAEQRLALCEARASAQFSLIMALYRLSMRKGVVTEAELADTFNQISATLQRGALEAVDLPESVRLDIDAHLAEIGRLRHHLEV